MKHNWTIFGYAMDYQAILSCIVHYFNDKSYTLLSSLHVFWGNCDSDRDCDSDMSES